MIKLRLIKKLIYFSQLHAYTGSNTKDILLSIDNFSLLYDLRSKEYLLFNNWAY